MRTSALIIGIATLLLAGCGSGHQPAAKAPAVVSTGHPAEDLTSFIAKWMESRLSAGAPAGRGVLYPAVWGENTGLVRSDRLWGVQYALDEIASQQPQTALRIIDRIRANGSVEPKDARLMVFIEAGLGRPVSLPELDTPAAPWEVVGFARRNGVKALPRLKKWSAPTWPGNIASAALTCRMVLDPKGTASDARAFLRANIPEYPKIPVAAALAGLGHYRAEKYLSLLPAASGAARSIRDKLARRLPLDKAKLESLELLTSGLVVEARDDPGAVVVVAPAVREFLSAYDASRKDRSPEYLQALYATRLRLEAALFVAGADKQLPGGWPDYAGMPGDLKDTQIRTVDDIYYLLSRRRRGLIRDWDSLVPHVYWMRIHK
jgi:hypothetical protein